MGKLGEASERTSVQSKRNRVKDKSYFLTERCHKIKIEQSSANCSLETHRFHETCLNIAQVPFRPGGEL